MGQKRKNGSISKKNRLIKRNRGLLKVLFAAGLSLGTVAFPLLTPILTAQENGVIQVSSVSDWNKLSGNKVKGNTVKIMNDISGKMGTLAFDPSVSFALTADAARTLDFQKNAQAISMNAKFASSHTMTISGENITIKNAAATDYFDYKGGAVYVYGSLTLDSTNYTFSDCHAGDTFHIIVRTYDAGALYSTGSMTLSGSNTFTNNSVSGSRCDSYGGAISSAGNMTLSGTEIFTGNSAKGSTVRGGALHAGKKLDISGTAIFKNNSVYGIHTTGSHDDAYGGAIYAGNGMTLNGTTEFSGNYAQGGTSGAWGGALAVEGNSLSLDGNYNFTNNNVRSYNTAGANSAYGGAISSEKSVSLKGTGSFVNNSVKNGCDAYGGALYLKSESTISGNQTFTGNSVTTSKSGALIQNQYALGGAIYAGAALNFSGSTVFTNNSVTSYKTAWGGAIYSDGHDITFSGNGSSAYFRNNTANGSPNDIYIRFGQSLSIRDSGSYYFGSGVETTSWIGKKGNMSISNGATVTLGAGGKSDLAGGISLAGSTLKIELTQGNRLSGQNDYLDSATATTIKGALSADSSSNVQFDIAQLGNGNYLVTKSNWSNASNVMSVVSDYYKSFDRSINSTKDQTSVTVSNAVVWPVRRFDKNGSYAAGEDSLVAVLGKNGNLANGDLIELSGDTSEKGGYAVKNGINLTIRSDNDGTRRTLDGSDNSSGSILSFNESGTVNTLTMSDLSFIGTLADQGAISTSGTLTLNADHLLFSGNRYALTGSGTEAKIALNGNANFTGNTAKDISAATVLLGDPSSENNFSFGSGIAATSLDASEVNAVFQSGSVTSIDSLTLSGDADLTFLLNGNNVVTNYSADFANGATELTASNISSEKSSNSLTFVVTGTYETANHEILAAVGDFSGVSDLISAQLGSNASGIAYVKWIGENADGKKGVWLGYENFETTSAVYRYQNGVKVDFGDTLLDAGQGDPDLAQGDSFVLTDDIEAINYDGALDLGALSVSILSNRDNEVRTIVTPDSETAITFSGGNELRMDDIAFDGGKNIIAFAKPEGVPVAESDGRIAVDLNNVFFRNAETAISATDLTLTGNAVFANNKTALTASIVQLDGNFTFTENTDSDISGAREVTLFKGGHYSFGSGIQTDALTVFLDKNNARDSQEEGTVLEILGKNLTGNSSDQKTTFLLTDLSSEYYYGTTSDWAEYSGTVYAGIDPILDATGYVFVESIDDRGVLLRYDNGTSLVYRTVSPDDSTVIGGGNTLAAAAKGVSSGALAEGNVFTIYGDTKETETTSIGNLSLTIQSEGSGSSRRIDGTDLNAIILAGGGNILRLSNIDLSNATVGISALAGEGKTGELTLLGTASFQNLTADIVAQNRLTLGNGTDYSEFKFLSGLATDHLAINGAKVLLGSDSISQIDESLSLTQGASVTLNATYDAQRKALYYSQLVASTADYFNDGSGTWSVNAPNAERIKTSIQANMLLSNDETLLDELHHAFHDRYHSLLYDVYIGKTQGAYGIYAQKADAEKVAQQVGGNAPSDLILYGDDFLDVPTVAQAQSNAQRLSRESFAAVGAAQIFRLSQINRMLTEQILQSDSQRAQTGEASGFDDRAESDLSSEAGGSSVITRGNLAESTGSSAGCRHQVWFSGYGSTGGVTSRYGFAGYDFQYGGFTAGSTWKGTDVDLALFYGYGQSNFSSWTSRVKSDDHTFGVLSRWDSLLGAGYTSAGGLFSFSDYRGAYLTESLNDHDALSGGVSLEKGWKVSTGTACWNPYAALQYIGYNGDSIQQGDMILSDQTVDSLRSRVGFRRTGTPLFFNQRAALQFGADWMHEFSDSRGSFIANVGDRYASIYGAETGRDWLETSLGLNCELSDQVELNGQYFVLTNRYITQQTAAGTLTFRY